jgi:hypothetical protein
MSEASQGVLTHSSRGQGLGRASPMLERAYLGRPDSESGKFYVQNVRREIPYNIVFAEFSV